MSSGGSGWGWGADCIDLIYNLSPLAYSWGRRQRGRMRTYVEAELPWILPPWLALRRLADLFFPHKTKMIIRRRRITAKSTSRSIRRGRNNSTPQRPINVIITR